MPITFFIYDAEFEKKAKGNVQSLDDMERIISETAEEDGIQLATVDAAHILESVDMLPEQFGHTPFLIFKDPRKMERRLDRVKRAIERGHGREFTRSPIEGKWNDAGLNETDVDLALDGLKAVLAKCDPEKHSTLGMARVHA